MWNRRRLVLQHQFSGFSNTPSSTPSDDQGSTCDHDELMLDLITSDLQFLVPLLRKYPKCYWIWNHRLWLLQQSTARLPIAASRRLWQQELGLVSKMLTLDSRNFHGWGYRRTVIAALESGGPDQGKPGTPDAAGRSRVEDEFNYTTKMIETNLSNFSAWHSRSKLIPRLLDERQADMATRKQFLDDGMQSAFLVWKPHTNS